MSITKDENEVFSISTSSSNSKDVTLDDVKTTTTLDAVDARLEASFLFAIITPSPLQLRAEMVVLVSLDLETNGLIVMDPKKRANITEIGAVSVLVYDDMSYKFLLRDPQLACEDALTPEYIQSEYQHADEQSHLRAFAQRVFCSNVSYQSSQITGITASMLVGKPPLPDAVDRFRAYVTSVCQQAHDTTPRIAVAYNGIKFDIPLLALELKSMEQDVERIMRILKFTYLFDPLPLSRIIVGEETLDLPRDPSGKPLFSLGGIYRALTGKALKNAHSSIPDAAAVLELILHQKCFTSVLKPQFEQIAKWKTTTTTTKASATSTSSKPTVQTADKHGKNNVGFVNIVTLVNNIIAGSKETEKKEADQLAKNKKRQRPINTYFKSAS